MESLHDDLIGLGDRLTIFAFFGSVALVLLLETLIPCREADSLPIDRWVNNTLLSLINQVMQIYSWPMMAAFYSEASVIAGSGILARLSLGPLPSMIVTLITMEFIGYWWHRLSHKVPWLWRLHAVHHSDTEVDATTSFRHHPAELMLSHLINLFVILALGPEPIVALVCSLTSIAVGAFNHGNISLGCLDQWLSYVFVTPGFHRVHHSAEKQFTDSNFSNNVPVFDYLFGTAKRWSQNQQATMPLGLQYFREKRDGWIDRLLIQPLMSHQRGTAASKEKTMRAELRLR